MPENDDHIFSDDAVEDETAGAARPFNRPLLKASLLGVIVSGVVVLISAILANVATANSDLEFAASVVNRLATVLMLAAFGGIFVAYQIPKLQKLGQSFHPGMPPTVIPTFPPQSAAMSNSETIGGQNPPIFEAARARPPAGYSESAYSSTAPSQASAERRPTTPAQAFLLLLMVNVCVVGAFWVLGFLLYQVGGQNMFGFILMPLMVLLPGLVVCMIVWHRGVLQAYAIGALPALLSLFFYTSTFAFAFSPRGNPWSVLISAGVGLSLVGLSGLLCAGYVASLLSFRGPPQQGQ